MNRLDNITRCPHCQTSFRVTDAQLSAAEGAVRCGSCLEVFQAQAHLLDSPDNDELDRIAPATASRESLLDLADLSDVQVLNDSTDPDPDDSETLSGAVIDQETDASNIVTGVEVNASLDDLDESDIAEYWAAEGEVGDNPTIPDDRVFDGIPALTAEDANLQREELLDPEREGPDQIEIQALYFESRDPAEIVGELGDSSAWRRWPWSLGAVVLVFGLGAQYAWYAKDRLAQNVTLRPYYQQFCRSAGCELQPYRNSTALTTTDLIVRSHPTLAKALKVDAIIKNAGAFGQLFPNLKLTFTDVNGRKIAQRTFEPEDYLAGELMGLRYFPAYTEVRLSLEIIDPGKAAVGYTITIESES